VRFEAGVFGLAAAMQHFFGCLKQSISPAEAFFLIERVSNIRSRLLVQKVDQTVRRALTAGVLCQQDVRQLTELYESSIKTGKIQDPEGSAIDRLQKAWRAA